MVMDQETLLVKSIFLYSVLAFPTVLLCKAQVDILRCSVEVQGSARLLIRQFFILLLIFVETSLSRSLNCIEICSYGLVTTLPRRNVTLLITSQQRMVAQLENRASQTLSQVSSEIFEPQSVSAVLLITSYTLASIGSFFFYDICNVVFNLSILQPFKS